MKKLYLLIIVIMSFSLYGQYNIDDFIYFGFEEGEELDNRIVTGKVFHDENKNGEQDIYPIRGIHVKNLYDEDNASSDVTIITKDKKEVETIKKEKGQKKIKIDDLIGENGNDKTIEIDLLSDELTDIEIETSDCGSFILSKEGNFTKKGEFKDEKCQYFSANRKIEKQSNGTVKQIVNLEYSAPCEKGIEGVSIYSSLGETSITDKNGVFNVELGEDFTVDLMLDERTLPEIEGFQNNISQVKNKFDFAVY